MSINSIFSTGSIGSVSVSRDEMSIEKFLIALKKKHSEKTPKEITLISKALEATDLMKKFSLESTEDDSLDRMLYFCSMFMKHKFFEKNRTIFNIGDKGDRFYIILKGKVKILKPVSNTEKLTSLEYYRHILSLRKENQKHLIKLHLKANQDAYPIRYQDVKNLEDIIFKFQYKKTLMARPSLDDIRKVFSQNQMNPKSYELSYENVAELREDTLKERIDVCINRQLSRLTSDLHSSKMLQYRYVENEGERKSVVLFILNDFMTLETGQYFGDLALEASKERTATIITDQDTHLGYLESDIYREYILIRKKKFTLREILFLLENFFLSEIRKETFENKYFPCFIYEEFVKGDQLLKENESNKYVYFIKEGDVEIYTHKNILEIHNIIKTLTSLNVSLPSDFNYYSFRNEPRNYLEDLKKKKLNKLFIYSQREVLGLEEFYFNVSSLYYAKVVSDKVKAYKIDVRDLWNIINEESYCKEAVKIFVNKRMSMLIKRYMDVKNVCLKVLDNKINDAQSKRLRETELSMKSNIVVPQNISSKITNSEKLKFKTPSFLSKDTLNISPIISNRKSTEHNISRFKLELPPVKTDKKIIAKQSLRYETKQIEALKEEIKSMDKFCLTAIKMNNTIDHKVLLDSGANYYLKTNQKNANKAQQNNKITTIFQKLSQTPQKKIASLNDDNSEIVIEDNLKQSSKNTRGRLIYPDVSSNQRISLKKIECNFLDDLSNKTFNYKTVTGVKLVKRVKLLFNK
jgi:CRP-like cAMP-binding protein